MTPIPEEAGPPGIDPGIWLRAIRRSSAAAADGTTLEEVAAVVMEEVCVAAGWPVGRLFVVADGLMSATEIWRLSDHARFGALVASTGFDMIGIALAEQAATRGAAVWRHEPRQAGPVGLVAFPIADGAGVVAAVEFFSDGPDGPTEELLAVATATVRQLGLVADRLRATAAAADSQRIAGELANQVLHDPLTGLANRVLLCDRVGHALARAGRRSSSVALFVADIDHFKLVNESLGHGGGDLLLVAVAERLTDLLRPGDTVARMGGDEFALLCEDVGSYDEAVGIAARILGAFGKPFRLKGADVSVTTSLGVAIGSMHDLNPETLVRDADVALYRAKEGGRDRYEVFEPTMLTGATERLSVESELRRAISQGDLRLYYQPIVELDSGVVAGFEALVRWQHPERGLLPPSEFIPFAEQSGLIVPLGRHVLVEACKQAATWPTHHHGPEPLRVSVNVSAKQLIQPGWSDEVAQALAESGLGPRQLVLEITESVLMDNTDATALRFEELRRLGVRIAIDDFGTGYSSLGYLRRLPVDILKIDKSFIDGVADGPHESALARAVVKLASTLRLEAVAEGITNRKQLAQLRRLHCPYGQGYFYSRPQPAAALPGLLDLGTLEGADPGE